MGVLQNVVVRPEEERALPRLAGEDVVMFAPGGFAMAVRCGRGLTVTLRGGGLGVPVRGGCAILGARRCRP